MPQRHRVQLAAGHPQAGVCGACTITLQPLAVGCQQSGELPVRLLRLPLRNCASDCAGAEWVRWPEAARQDRRARASEWSAATFSSRPTHYSVACFYQGGVHHSAGKPSATVNGLVRSLGSRRVQTASARGLALHRTAWTCSRSRRCSRTAACTWRWWMADCAPAAALPSPSWVRGGERL